MQGRALSVTATSTDNGVRPLQPLLPERAWVPSPRPPCGLGLEGTCPRPRPFKQVEYLSVERRDGVEVGKLVRTEPLLAVMGGSNVAREEDGSCPSRAVEARTRNVCHVGVLEAVDAVFARG
jgi:hypothetical protein